jgi:hypothetical protein
VALLMVSFLSAGCQHQNASKASIVKPPSRIPYTIKEIRYCFS